jgi:hypothetical protein
MSRYTAKDGHVATKDERALLDYISARWHGDYQLAASKDGYHLCTKFACCQFTDLNSLKEFLGEKWQN